MPAAEGKPGRIGSQICRSAAELTHFVDWVTGESQAKDFTGVTELIINGDMVDFLSPEQAAPSKEWISDQQAAILRLEGIITRSRSGGPRGPFEALAEFLQKDRTELTMLLGNHDVELALPAVREHLEKVFGSATRFRLICDGEALVRGRVLIEHGNRYDSWNALSYNGLREERSHLSRGLRVDEGRRKERFFRPPAGTLMVVYAINTVLAESPFLNLLKPETGAAIPLLLALEPNLRGVLNNILSLAPVAARKKAAKLESPAVPVNRDNLTADVGSRNIDSLEKLLRPMLGKDADLFLAPTAAPLGAAAGLKDARDWIRAKAAEIAAAWQSRPKLGAVARAAVLEQKIKLLEVAFRPLQGERTFELIHEQAEYLAAAAALLETNQFDVVVFGHTHLPKRIEVARRSGKSGFYLNTGTWADTMRLPPEVFAGGDVGRAAIRKLFEDMGENRIDDYRFVSLGYAEIELAGEEVTTFDLRSYSQAQPRSAAFAPHP